MSEILVFAEFSENKLKRSSQELLSCAKSSNKSCTAVLLGSGAKKVAEQAFAYGAEKCLVLDDGALDTYNPEIFKDVLTQAIKKATPTVVLASGSAISKDLLPSLAATFESGIAADCTSLSLNPLKVIKPLYAGKCFAEVEFCESPISFITMRANQLPLIEPIAGASGTVEDLTLPQIELRTKIKEVIAGVSKTIDLTEANIIISGGRGLKEAANFKILQDFAEVIGASVGASRAVVDEGWVSHSMQVGQTGKTVAPSLYFAVGISGAIQHMAGMSGSKVIVAINKDPDAPIFQKATYGIVGDLFEVMPVLQKEFAQALS